MPRHIVILPYFCDEEIQRYLKVAELLKSFPHPDGSLQFLLASSPRTQPSESLQTAYSSIGETWSFQCPTQIFGYPEGPTAMFWDCMDFIAERFGHESGFSLWLESDMAPIKPDWIDRLSQQWFSELQTPIMMGCFVPQVFKHRWFKKPKLILEPHINGGACYALDFARHMPGSAREGVFDMAVYQHAAQQGRARNTSLIAFSTVSQVRRDLLDEHKVLLHGFMQPKDEFLQQCLHPLTEQEKQNATWNAWWDQWETLKRQLRVQFVRKGQRAMLENMFLAKQKFEAEQNQPVNSPSTTTRYAA